MTQQDIINKVYTAFNGRDIPGVLAHMHPNVDWPNGWEGGYVHGHAEVTDYWTRQWQEIDPIVTPTGFKELPDGRLQVTVKQLIKNLNGDVLADGLIYHAYTFLNGLITRMEISEVA